MVCIEIDYRENSIIELFNKVKDINFKVCNLIIGDFIIKNEFGEILFVIERKSVKDLCASITDGRHSEQKSRLIESIQDPNKIVYIIEGKKSEGLIHGKSIDTSKKSINSSILNLIFKHSYRVIFSESKQDTVDNLVMLYTKIKESKLSLAVNETANVIKIIKKSDKINDNIFINMLAVIPGVSAKIAVKIHEQYDTLNKVMLAYNDLPNENDKKKMLSEIIVNTDTNRKVGKATSEKIYYSFFKKSEKLKEEKVETKKITRLKKKEDHVCLI